MLEFKRRVGRDPHENGMTTANLRGCPDIWEMSDGSFAVIGRDVTSVLAAKMPPTASCGPDERIVLLPRGTLVNAKNDIPE